MTLLHVNFLEFLRAKNPRVLYLGLARPMIGPMTVGILEPARGLLL